MLGEKGLAEGAALGQHWAHEFGGAGVDAEGAAAGGCCWVGGGAREIEVFEEAPLEVAARFVCGITCVVVVVVVVLHERKARDAWNAEGGFCCGQWYIIEISYNKKKL